MSKPYAVQITITHEDGSTVTQKHVRGKVRLSKEAFASMALGKMLRMVSEWDDTRGMPVTGWKIEEVQVGPFG